jgi:hypothetical protein
MTHILVDTLTSRMAIGRDDAGQGVLHDTPHQIVMKP